MRNWFVVVSLSSILGACQSKDTPRPSEATLPPFVTATAYAAGEGPPTCRATCTTAADCAVAGNPLSDASHFTCVSGLCEWTGCKSAAECAGAAHSSKITCATPPGSTTPQCVPTCTTAADCAVAGNQLTDASHFTCSAGRCQWQGCKSTSECAAVTKTNKVVCERAPGAPAPDCEPTCTTAADCASPGQPLTDASHFSCQNGRCTWLGCRSTSECTSAMHSAKYVCR